MTEKELALEQHKERVKQNQILEYKKIYQVAEANFNATQNPRFLDIQLKCLETIRQLQEEINE